MGNLPKFTLHEARVLLKLEHIGPPGFLTEDEHEAWNALLDGARERVRLWERPRTPTVQRSTIACRRCGEHHILGEHEPGMRVVANGKPGTVTEWRQYNGPLYVRVKFDERNEHGDPVRANFDPCQLATTPHREGKEGE